MKKNYQQPNIEVIKIEANIILAGSGPGSGSAKDPGGPGSSRSYDDLFDDLFDDDF